MKLTIDITVENEDEVGKLYYQVLAKRVGEHVAELISLGNMDENFVAGIYRKIADALERKEVSLDDISTELGAVIVRAGWFDAMDGPQNASAVIASPLPTIKAKNTTHDDVRSFNERLQRISDLVKINLLYKEFRATDCTNRNLDKKLSFVLEAVAVLQTIVPNLLLEIEEASRETNCLVVDDKFVVIGKNKRAIDGKNYWSVQESDFLPVFSWSDIIRFNFSCFTTNDLIEQIVRTGRSDLLLKLKNALTDLPPFIMGSVTQKLEPAERHLNQTADLKVWLEEGLVSGLARMAIENKITDEYPELEPNLHDILKNIEFMFPSRTVLRKQKSGRLTFIFASKP